MQIGIGEKKNTKYKSRLLPATPEDEQVDLFIANVTHIKNKLKEEKKECELILTSIILHIIEGCFTKDTPSIYMKFHANLYVYLEIYCYLRAITVMYVEQLVKKNKTDRISANKIIQYLSFSDFIFSKTLGDSYFRELKITRKKEYMNPSRKELLEDILLSNIIETEAIHPNKNNVHMGLKEDYELIVIVKILKITIVKGYIESLGRMIEHMALQNDETNNVVESIFLSHLVVLILFKQAVIKNRLGEEHLEEIKKLKNTIFDTAEEYGVCLPILTDNELLELAYKDGIGLEESEKLFQNLTEQKIYLEYHIINESIEKAKENASSLLGLEYEKPNDD